MLPPAPARRPIVEQPAAQPGERPAQQARHVHLRAAHLLGDLHLAQLLEEPQAHRTSLGARQRRQQAP
jgi:hypothetical protein